MARKAVPRAAQHAILVKSRRRCAFCYHLETDTGLKEGQIAHIDRNAENNAEDNLVWLCREHHDRYDSKPSQTKGFMPEEARTAKTALENAVEQDFGAFLKGSGSAKKNAKGKPVRGVSTEVYGLRYPVYAAFRKFVLSILTSAEVVEQERHNFVEATADALFLFGEEVDNYLFEIHRRAMRLRTAQRTITRADHVSPERVNAAMAQDEELLLSFEKELGNGKQLFAKYLRLA